MRSTYAVDRARRPDGRGAGGPEARCNLETRERVEPKTEESSPEKQQEALDVVESPAPHESTAAEPLSIVPPSTPPPKPGEESATSWGPGQVPRLGGWQARLPSRRRRPFTAVKFLVGALLVAGGFVYFRLNRTRSYGGGEVHVPDAGTRVATTSTAAAPGPADAGPLAFVLGTPADGIVAERDLDGGAVSAPAGPSPDCVPLVAHARDLWRGRDRAGAVQKAREAMACDPMALEPLLLVGRWFLEVPGLARDELSTDVADAFLRAAEANANHGELWFYTTDILFRAAGRGEDAVAARTHCLAIRPGDADTASCRYLPQ